MGGKKTGETIFPDTHEYGEKNVGKKIVGNKCEKVFFIHTNIVTKKWRKKTRETIFPETQE